MVSSFGWHTTHTPLFARSSKIAVVLARLVDTWHVLGVFEDRAYFAKVCTSASEDGVANGGAAIIGFLNHVPVGLVIAVCQASNCVDKLKRQTARRRIAPGLHQTIGNLLGWRPIRIFGWSRISGTFHRVTEDVRVGRDTVAFCASVGCVSKDSVKMQGHKGG